MRTLIVEDETGILNLFKSVLEKYGTCTLAANGKEAIAAFEKAWDDAEPFDLICIDILMPGMSGLEALRKIRKIEKKRNIDSDNEAKVVITTGVSESKEVIEALYKGGASAYFVKPTEITAFIEELEKLGLIGKERTQ